MGEPLDGGDWAVRLFRTLCGLDMGRSLSNGSGDLFLSLTSVIVNVQWRKPESRIAGAKA